MLDRFQQYMCEHSLANEQNRLILAVSGGIDSMVMMHLFNESGRYHYAVAHCNFKLRGNESDMDQEFVKSIAEKNNKEFFTVNFNTREYAAENNLSIQMAARELRYNWFSKLAKEHKFDRVAVAHNQDDIIETSLINLVRGTGIKGLTGIKTISGITIRPLLFASRIEIENYAKKHQIKFREDSSNIEVKYKRNLIRHRILPLLRQLNPSVKKTLIQETEIFSATWDIYRREIDLIKQAVLSKRKNRYFLNINKLIERKINPALLYDLLSEFEFSFSVVKNIFNSLDSEPGKKFYSTKYMLLKDRDFLIIEGVDESVIEGKYQIKKNMSELNFPLHISIHKLRRNNDFTWPKVASIASLDFDKLNFPLNLRRWQEGDFFYPLGLGGKKKLSDFFIDEKIDLFGKKRIWLLTSGNDVVWIAGYRIDDRFKITPRTKNILMLEIKD